MKKGLLFLLSLFLAGSFLLGLVLPPNLKLVFIEELFKLRGTGLIEGLACSFLFLCGAFFLFSHEFTLLFLESLEFWLLLVS